MTSREPLTLRYVDWCEQHHIPTVLGALPAILGYASPLAFTMWLGWWGAPLTAIGLFGNQFLLDAAKLFKEEAEAAEAAGPPAPAAGPLADGSYPVGQLPHHRIPTG